MVPDRSKAMPMICGPQAREWLTTPAENVTEIQARILPTDALEGPSEDEGKITA